MWLTGAGRENEGRQERSAISPETTSAVDQWPTREKVCVIPCAKAHRPIGVHTDMARVAVGKAAPSPMPSSIRARNNDASPPTAPGSLTAVAASATRVDLAWLASTADVGVTGYSITRHGSLLTPVAVLATSFRVTTAPPNTAYTPSWRA